VSPPQGEVRSWRQRSPARLEQAAPCSCTAWIGFIRHLDSCYSTSAHYWLLLLLAFHQLNNSTQVVSTSPSTPIIVHILYVSPQWPDERRALMMCCLPLCHLCLVLTPACLFACSIRGVRGNYCLACSQPPLLSFAAVLEVADQLPQYLQDDRDAHDAVHKVDGAKGWVRPSAILFLRVLFLCTTSLRVLFLCTAFQYEVLS
jgi:hypothetical protein